MAFCRTESVGRVTMARRTCWAAAAAFCLSQFCADYSFAGDEVVLTSGIKIRGEVVCESGGSVTIRTQGCEMTWPLGKVHSVTSGGETKTFNPLTKRPSPAERGGEPAGGASPSAAVRKPTTEPVPTPPVLRDDRSPSELVAALGGEDAVARFTAEEALITIGDAGVAALEPLATSPGFTPARQYAINTLARIGSRKAVGLLLRVLEEEQDAIVRGLVCRHLGRMGIEEAVPIIGKWLLAIRGKSFDWKDPRDPRVDAWGNPHSITRPYAWVLHVHALREIGSEKGIPILEGMLKTKHGGKAGRDLAKAYRVDLSELKKEAAFWRAVRRVRGLERHVKLLFDFFRRDTLALIRLHRDKVVGVGLEGRWVLQDMKNHPDEKLQRAAAALLRNYGRLQPRP